jgi:hypothetical protein
MTAIEELGHGRAAGQAVRAPGAPRSAPRPGPPLSPAIEPS